MTTVGGGPAGTGPGDPLDLDLDLDLKLPAHGTGVRAARRAAAAQTEPESPPAPPAEVPREDAPVPAPVPVPAPRPGPSRRWMIGFASALLVAVLLGGALAVTGIQTLRDSSAGRTLTSTDPSEPGFEGLLEPTPTLLVLHTSNGLLQSAALLSLATGDAGGSVILLPPSVEVGDTDDATTLAVTVGFNREPDVLRTAAEPITGVGVQELVILDDARWEELVAPVGPVAIDNPDDIEGFPAGRLDLAATNVASWLRATRPGESQLAALYRQELFWEAWIAAVAAAGDEGAVPGELDSGLGRFVRGLAAGRTEVVTIPGTEVEDDAGNTVYAVDRDALQSVITELVPFPIGTALAPRTRVRLLDGTGDGDHVRRIAPTVVEAEATIVVVGNANAFDYETSEIRYHQPSQRTAAERLQRALGAGRVVEDVRPIDAFDVTIVLGTDT